MVERRDPKQPSPRRSRRSRRSEKSLFALNILAFLLRAPVACGRIRGAERVLNMEDSLLFASAYMSAMPNRMIRKPDRASTHPLRDPRDLRGKIRLSLFHQPQSHPVDSRRHKSLCDPPAQRVSYRHGLNAPHGTGHSDGPNRPSEGQDGTAMRCFDRRRRHLSHRVGMCNSTNISHSTKFCLCTI